MTLLEQLQRDEGRRDRPYQDSRGVWTVGYGHNLTTGALSEAAMRQILMDDIAAATKACATFPVWASLSDIRKAVLVNMAFNLGLAGLTEFHQMFAALAAQDWNGAAMAMLHSAWAFQVGDRARRLAEQMRSDQWI